MNVEEIRQLLIQVCNILERHAENNWVRGIRATLGEIDTDNSPDALDRARTIYASLNRGQGGFSDYNIWLDDFEERQKANSNLDDLRVQLWKAFDL